MDRRRSALWACAPIALLAVTTAASAQVGEPTGTFGIKIMHGNTVVVNNPSVMVPMDIKISDGDPEDHVQIGTIGPMNAPIILKIVSDDDPNFRIVHWYVDVPLSLSSIHLPGPTSLFDPANPAPIDVTISGLQFTNTTEVTPLVVDNDTYLTAFMRDMGGVFYNMPNGKTIGFPGPGTEVQVPARFFCDANTAQYDVDNCLPSRFNGPLAQPTATWSWRGLPNPGPNTTTNNGFNPNAPSFGAGYVFELGLSMAFLGVPEPNTLAMLSVGLIGAVCRRRRR